MKKKRTHILRRSAVFCAAVLCVFCFTGRAFADEKAEKAPEDDPKDRILSLLPDEAADLLSEENEERLIDRFGARGLFTLFADAVAETQRSAVSFFAICLAFCLLSALAGECSLSEEVRPYLRLGVALTVLSPLLFDLSGCLQKILADLGGVNSFFGSAVPAFCAVEAAGGGNFSASVENVGMGVTLTVLTHIESEIAAPLVRLMFALALLSAVDPDGRTDRVAERVSRAFFTVSGAVSALSVGFFSLQSAVASAKDRGALRAARYAAGLLPGVGSTLSASLSSLAGGIVYLKGAVGASVIAAALSLAVLPLCELLFRRIALFCASVLLDLLGDRESGRFLLPFRTALDATLWLYVLSVSTWIFEVVIFMKSGVAIEG